MNPPVEYSPEEIEVLREIFASTETMESQAHRLPSRSIVSMERKARNLGIKKARPEFFLSRIEALMADGKARTASEIATAVGVRTKRVQEHYRIFADGVTAHIAGFVGSYRSAMYKAGPGENAVRPPPAHIPMKVYSARHRARKRELAVPKQKKPAPTRAARPIKPRAQPQEFEAAWWPWADPVVCDAFAAMARVGRGAA